MRKFLLNAILALAAVFAAADCSAQSAAPEFQGIESLIGYEITKDIKVSRSKSANARFDMTIKAGRVCVRDARIPSGHDSYYEFELIDCAEYIVLGKDYIQYYEPAQDGVPARYARRTVFNQSAKRVAVYKGAPSSWKAGEAVTLVPRVKGPYIKKVTVTPLVIKDKNAVYVDDNGSSKSSVYNKQVYRITYYTEDGTFTLYSYKGVQLMKNNLDAQGEFLEDFAVDLKVDNDGYCFAKSTDEDSDFKHCSELGPVVGEYPSVGLVGWLSPAKMVIDDVIYDVIK